MSARRRLRAACGAAAALATVAGMSVAVTVLGAKPAGAAPVVRSGFADDVVFSGLNEPTALAFAPDGEVFVAEKSGVILRYDSVTDPSPTQFADLRTEVHNFWDRGLLGLAVDPQFPARPYVYALYDYDHRPGDPTVPAWGTPGADSDGCPTPPGATTDGCVIQARLSRLTDDGGTMSAEKVLVEGWCMQFPSHSIGTVLVGQDGNLYAGAGDGGSFGFADYGQVKNPCGDPPGAVGTNLAPPTAEGGALRAQSVRRPAGQPVVLNGSIIRVDPDTGDPVPGGPFAGNPDVNARRIVAYGMRNPFRFTQRPGTDELWVGDVGWSTVEEIDRIPHATDAVAENFGWPCYEGPGHQPGYEAAGLNLCTTLYAANNVTAPYFSYQHNANVSPGDTCPTGSSSIAGLAFENGTSYPAEYDGALFFTDYSRDCIWVMKRGANGQPDPNQVTPFETGIDGAVQLDTGPDGNLWYVSLSGAVHRIRFLAGNHQPVAHAAADATAGDPGVTVHFDGSQSTDADGDPLSYAWDLDGDGLFDDSTAVNPQWTYNDAARVTVRLQVSDGHGGTGTDELSLTIGNPPAPPTPVIDTPTAADQWKVGDPIDFSGHATDGAGNPLPASALSWHVVMYHCPSNCHTHPIQDFPGVASGQFPAPDHEYPSYLQLVLTATADGQTATTTLRLDPLPVGMTFATQPAGLQLSVFSDGGAAPLQRTVIVGSAVSVSAPLTQNLNGRTYDFVSWSDGGAATHNVTATAAPPTLTATYQARALGLVAAYGFNEGAGVATADISGHGNTALLATGATWVPAGRAGRAVAFTATAGAATITDNDTLGLEPGMTLEAWVRPSVGTGQRLVLGKQRTGGLAWGLFSSTASGRPGGTAFLNGADRTVTAPGALPLNTWSHLALSYDGSMLRLYVNAVLAGSTPATGALPVLSGPVQIGGDVGGTRYAGQVDEVRVYDRGLTQPQLAADRLTPVVTAFPATGPGWPAVAPLGTTGVLQLAVNGPAVVLRTVNAGAAPVTVGPREQPATGITGAPSVVADPAAGRTLVFGRGAGNAIYYRIRTGATWSAWIKVPGSLAAASPTAVLHGAQVELFYPAPGGAIRHQVLSGSVTWTAPETVPGLTTHQVGAYLLPNGQLRLWVVGTNAAAYASSGSTGHWAPWKKVDAGISAIAGTTGFDAAGREDVVAVGSRGRLYQAAFTAGLATFSGWRQLDATVPLGQAVVASTAGRGRLLVVVGDGRTLTYDLYANGRWSGLTAMP